MSLLNDIRILFQKPPAPETGEGVDGTGKVENSKPVLKFNKSRDLWTVGDAFEGTQIFGATGSGKTSGSGKHIALSLLKSGFGGLVLTAKRDELKTWIGYAKEANRLNDVIVFGPTVKTGETVLENRQYRFNFLEYERQASPIEGQSLTDNLVSLFSTVIEVSSRGNGQGTGDAYWIHTLKQLLRNAIDLLVYAGKPLTFKNIHGVISTAPQSLSELDAENYRQYWEETTLCGNCVEVLGKIDEEDPRYEDATLTWTYWMREFPALAPETRSIIISYFTSMADTFLRGTLRNLFSSEPQEKELCPELTHEGKIIIIDLPIKVFQQVGQFAQVLYKYIWQRAAERRDPDAPGQRPLFLWADESQFFVNSRDMLFQTTARAARVATVYLTQNISNYYALMPGPQGTAETDALLGNFQTKIFHANGDSVTNQWAANVISQDLIARQSRTATAGTQAQAVQGIGSQFGSTFQEVLQFQVLPLHFTTLLKGGIDNGLKVNAIIFQGGKKWSNGKNHIAVTFDQ